MATNVFFNHAVRSEQNLYEDIIIESLKMFGQDVLYIPREVITKDELLNEDYARFTDTYTVEMYIENTDNWEGEGDLMSKFGLQIRDQATFICSKRRWEKEISLWNVSNIDRPKEGDLLYLPLTSNLFQISFVEHEQPFYALGNLPVYKLNAELFEYSDEEFETGVKEIDNIELAYSNYEIFGTNTGNGVSFITGETVTQGTDITDVYVTGEISKIEHPGGSNTAVLYINDSTGTDGIARSFVVSSTYPIIGSDSGASWTIYSSAADLVFDNKPWLTNDKLNRNDPAAQNATFSTESDAIIDFSENNPFGEP